MEFLRSLFEEQLTATISSNNEVEIGKATFSPARILKELEPGTYEPEFEEWKASRFTEALAKADGILDQFGNRDRFQKLEDACKRGIVIPVIGAGMSFTSGYRTWTEYLWWLHTDSHVPASELEHLITAGAYERAAELLLADLGERLFNERLHSTYRTSDSYAVRGPINYLPRLFQKAVLTTNFDGVLEFIYTIQGRPFKRVLLGKDGESFNRFMAEGEFCLYKLHGDYAFADTRILTFTEYEDAYRNDSPLTSSLKQTFISSTLLFLGCSLHNDRTLRLMQALAHEVKEIPHHYALLEAPNNDGERKNRQKFLAERNIFPIWYSPGEHDDSIEALFVKLLSDMNSL
ncbi:MAG TPA: SIR2 family protein [Anaerolineales bacterium]|nr:SIR2 family protein [Anaerolineales bacterium]